VKIYTVPIGKKLKPIDQPFKYPKHNRDFGVEQDFDQFIIHHQELHTDNPNDADWHYLPVYWTRWHLNHDYGKTGLAELQAEIGKAIIDDGKTFTICQYDDGPLANIGRTVQFLASRRTDSGIDIPLLSAPHRRPLFMPRKLVNAAFIGRLDTHVIRQDMADVLRTRKDVFIHEGNKGSRFFVRETLKARIALAPRGYGGSSFRFFEAMELGVVPFLIGDIDTRPFKRFINWDELSLYTSKMSEINRLLDLYDVDHLEKMGQQCGKVFREHLTYQKWCHYVIEELKSLC
jgi:hypothetical protein